MKCYSDFKKEVNPTIYNNMDELEDIMPTWNKPILEE